jgi:hypothetical protein
LIDIRYDGVQHFVVDKDSPDYQRDTYEDYEENGRIVWSEVQSKKYGSGSYEK